MADFLINNLFRITLTTLNYVSPSILADILLHPFDFATVLLQIGYDPEGIKSETATLVSVILQYALLTFYIPYLLTSIQGLQFMGMPHPSIFYYVHYIYNKEGFFGCYRGLLLKICERLIMVGVNERIKKSISKDTENSESRQFRSASNEDTFMENLINNICSQFFSVLVSHPFHVLMVSNFAEFTYNKNSSTFELLQSIYKGDGCFGFFTGLTARLLGELLSLIFSTTYTAVINRQSRQQQNQRSSTSQKNVSHVVNYVTYMSRFTAFKQPESKESEAALSPLLEELPEVHYASENQTTGYFQSTFNFLANIIRSGCFGRNTRRNGRFFSFLSFVPLTSKLFYYIVIRDYLSKKISNPFFLVCHCSIILGTGWDKFPITRYFSPLSEKFCQRTSTRLMDVSRDRKRLWEKLIDCLCVVRHL